jgi:hypothetical protein
MILSIDINSKLVKIRVYLPFFIAKKGRAKKSSAVFLSLRFTSEISTTSVITSVLPRGTRISVCLTCSKNKAHIRFLKRFRLKNRSPIYQSIYRIIQ